MDIYIYTGDIKCCQLIDIHFDLHEINNYCTIIISYEIAWKNIKGGEECSTRNLTVRKLR